MLAVFRLELGALRLVGTHRGDATVRPELFDAAPIELARLWSW